MNEHKCYDKAFGELFDQATFYANSGDFQKALEHYERAYSLNPNSFELLWNVGIINEELGRLKNAIKLYEMTLELNPNASYLMGNLFLTKLRICDWSNYEAEINSLLSGISDNRKVCPPFVATVFSSSPELQLKVAVRYGGDLFPSFSCDFKKKKNTKVKIGYFSADFHNHATSYLMMELFELHDKEKFELFAFSFGPNIDDDSRRRIINSFDHFIDICEQTDDQVVGVCRALGIDIAIDLKGYTRDMRMGIFSKRVAPIQINYLGYPGTMGVNYYDYIIADKVLIPKNQSKFYSEKIIYLPDSYQVNDSRRFSPENSLKKKDCGLPEDVFIFCCFNSSYKISPNVFDSWVKILSNTPKSILWLYEDNEVAAQNLVIEGSKRGIHNRIFFAKKMPVKDHLFRLTFADVVLDTYPYGAHTTASDALLAGVPVITRVGESFASRVAASLLNALDLNELVTTTQQDYENLAISMAANPRELIDLREKIRLNKFSKKLFLTKDFANNLEDAYLQIYDLYKKDLPAREIEIFSLKNQYINPH